MSNFPTDRETQCFHLAGEDNSQYETNGQHFPFHDLCEYQFVWVTSTNVVNLTKILCENVGNLLQNSVF